MAITLNLKHSFTTRVVYSAEDIQGLREGMAECAEKYKDSTLSKMKGLAEWASGQLAKCDADLVLSYSREFTKQGVRDLLLTELDGCNVTRMSPIRTVVVIPGEPFVLMSDFEPDTDRYYSTDLSDGI